MFDLFYRSGIWFCNAYDTINKRWGVFRCDYMLEIKDSQSEHVSFSEEEMLSFLRQYEEVFHDIPFECQLTPYGKELFLKRHYPNMELMMEEEIPYIRGSYNEEHLDYLLQYLVSLGKHVKILFPMDLERRYKNELKTILSLYD